MPCGYVVQSGARFHSGSADVDEVYVIPASSTYCQHYAGDAQALARSGSGRDGAQLPQTHSVCYCNGK